MEIVLALILAACGGSKEAAPPAPAPAPPPTVAAPTPPGPHGTVEQRTFHSEALGVDKTYYVYSPAGDADKPTAKYPVFYYLQWPRRRRAQLVQVAATSTKRPTSSVSRRTSRDARRRRRLLLRQRQEGRLRHAHEGRHRPVHAADEESEEDVRQAGRRTTRRTSPRTSSATSTRTTTRTSTGAARGIAGMSMGGLGGAWSLSGLRHLPRRVRGSRESLGLPRHALSRPASVRRRQGPVDPGVPAGLDGQRADRLRRRRVRPRPRDHAKWKRAIRSCSSLKVEPGRPALYPRPRHRRRVQVPGRRHVHPRHADPRAISSMRFSSAWAITTSSSGSAARGREFDVVAGARCQALSRSPDRASWPKDGSSCSETLGEGGMGACKSRARPRARRAGRAQDAARRDARRRAAIQDRVSLAARHSPPEPRRARRAVRDRRHVGVHDGARARRAAARVGPRPQRRSQIRNRPIPSSPSTKDPSHGDVTAAIEDHDEPGRRWSSDDFPLRPRRAPTRRGCA